MDWFSIKNKSSSMTEALALYKEARAPRDYKREYAQYHSKPSRVAERSQRNKARRKLGLEKGDPREVDHKNPISNGGSNARSNLRAVSLQANRKKFTKTANDHHHLVTGHSGSGKSTLANKLSKELGLPVHALDWDPEVEKLWAYQKEYAKKNDGKLDMSDKRKDYEKRVKLDAIHRALKMKDPRIIEGSYLMYEDPASLGGHRRYLVNPSKETILEQRLNRKKQKDIKRGRGWTPEAERQARHRGIEVYNLYEPYAKKWRDSSLVEKRAARLYHGSPHEGLTSLIPREPRGHTDYQRQRAVFMTDNPNAAALYALARDKERKNRGWSAIGGRLQLGPGASLNEKGYLYSVDTDDYQTPPVGQENSGFAIPREIGVSGVKEVTPAEYEHLIDRFDTKDAFKAHVGSLVEKRASQACDSCGCDPCDCGWGTHAHIKEAKKLTARARNRISEGNFALPNRRYPIHDITHARNALSMVARHGTASEKAKVRKAVKAKFPSIGK